MKPAPTAIMATKRKPSGRGGARIAATPGPRGYPPNLAAQQARIAAALRKHGARIPLAQRETLRAAIDEAKAELEQLDKPSGAGRKTCQQ